MIHLPRLYEDGFYYIFHNILIIKGYYITLTFYETYETI